jgi:phosphotransferase system HPr-like phosphotransfer protein
MKGMRAMKVQRNIKLDLEEVRDFVEAASRCSFDIDIFYNRYVVDAKSILGVYGLDLTKTLTVSYNGFDPAFEEYLTELAVA